MLSFNRIEQAYHINSLKRGYSCNVLFALQVRAKDASVPLRSAQKQPTNWHRDFDVDDTEQRDRFEKHYHFRFRYRWQSTCRRIRWTARRTGKFHTRRVYSKRCRHCLSVKSVKKCLNPFQWILQVAGPLPTIEVKGRASREWGGRGEFWCVCCANNFVFRRRSLATGSRSASSNIVAL